jgi:hypothetical protein
MLVTLIYGSSAAHDLTEQDLLDILQVSKKNNEPLGVTGMLLYKSGNFIQVLEGEEEVVEALYKKIERDPRHHSSSIIFKREIQQREFADWSMSFANIDKLDPADYPGLSDFIKQPIGPDVFRDQPAYALIFLKSFMEIVR